MDHGDVGIRLRDMVEGLLPPSAFSVVVVTEKTKTFRNSADSRVYWHRNGAVVETGLVNHEEADAKHFMAKAIVFLAGR